MSTKNRFNLIKPLFSTLFLFLFLTTFAHADIKGKVVKVFDGDTILVKSGHKYHTIRLYGIDCPELKKREGERTQPYGRKAKNFASSIALHKYVNVKIKEKAGRRYIGIVTMPNGTILNEQMLKAGLAWWYHVYCSNLKWAKMEAVARAKRKGLWRDNNPVPPWVFRNKKYLEKTDRL